MSKTFGKMLANFRFAKNQAIEQAKDRLWKRNDVPLHQQSPTEGYEIRESSRIDRNGNTVVKMELWKRVDEERVKISPSISVEVLEDEDKKEDDWLA